MSVISHKALNIGVFAKKGGIGKTDTSLKLFEAFRHAHKRVLLNDWDPQGTSTKAFARFYPDYEKQKPDAPEIVIWDTPPNLEHTATKTAALSVDIAIVLTTPAPSDDWEAAETVEFIRRQNPTAEIRVVTNRYKTGTILSNYVDLERTDLNAPVLPIMLNDRECSKHLVIRGWKGLDGAAKLEAAQLATAVLSLSLHKTQKAHQ